MSDGSKKFRRQMLKQLKRKNPSPLKVRRLLQKNDPILLTLLTEVCELANPRIKARLIGSVTQAVLGKKATPDAEQALKNLLVDAVTQNPLINLKQPYKSKPCGGCQARRGGICRCAQKALNRAA